MSQENVDTVYLGYEALSAGDFVTFMGGLHPEIEYESVISAVEGSGGVFRGYEGIHEWLDSWADREVWSSWELRPTEVFDLDDDHVVARAVFDGRARSGVPIHAEFGVLFTFQDGLVIRIEDHPTPEAVLESMGLPRWKLWWLRRRLERQAVEREGPGFRSAERGP